jgi:hypothetical protein
VKVNRLARSVSVGVLKIILKKNTFSGPSEKHLSNLAISLAQFRRRRLKMSCSSEFRAAILDLKLLQKDTLLQNSYRNTSGESVDLHMQMF